MPTTYSPNKLLPLQTTGENNGTWGVVLNTGISQVDLALGGSLPLTMTNADITLTDEQARNAFFPITGALAANVALVFPNRGSFYIVSNATTGNFTLTVRPAGGTGFIVPQGRVALIFINSATASASGLVPDTYGQITTVRTLTAGTNTFSVLDKGAFVRIDAPNANFLVVPNDSNVALPVNSIITAQQVGVGQTTVVADTGVTLQAAGNRLKFAEQFSCVTFIKVAANTWAIVGGLTA